MICAAPKFNGVPPFPDNPRDGVAWDEFWRRLLFSRTRHKEQFWRGLLGNRARHKLDFEHLRLDVADFQYRLEYIPVLRQRGLRRVLFAGNGISALPHLFAHQGLQAVALDLSACATDFARNNLPDDRLLWHFLSSSYLIDQAILEQRPSFDTSGLVPPGTAEFLKADLFTYDPGKETFDAAVTQHVVEHFTPADRRKLAQQFYDWLIPGGILIVESQHYLTALDATDEMTDGIEQVFEEAGFLFHLKEAYAWREEQYRLWFRLPVPARAARQIEIAREFGERATVIRALDFAQLRDGRKLVALRHSR